MKKYIVRVIIITLVAAFFVAAHAYSSEQKVVAKVGDKSITQFEFAEALKSYKPPSVYHDVSPERMHQFEGDALNELIEVELLHKEAQYRGIKISGSVINGVVEENIQRLGSKKIMTRELNRKGISLDQFKEQIKKHQMVISLIINMRRAYPGKGRSERTGCRMG
jgi:parvulin-like peptidyl-prolyl isomerase